MARPPIVFTSVSTTLGAQRLNYLLYVSGFRDSRIAQAVKTNYGFDGRVSNSGTDKIFPLFTISRPALGVIESPIQWVRGPISRRVKLLGCETDHSPPSSSEMKNDAAIL
jgi:hypothetical protein